MLREWDFQLPTRIRFGSRRLKDLGHCTREFGTRVLLVGYRDRRGLEAAYAQAASVLGEAGLSVIEFYEVPPEPDAELADRGARLALEADAETVVGLGGGSVIDAAKGIALLAKMGGNLWDYTGANPQCRPVTDALPVVAVPTTAGTGTEVSPVAVFKHHGVGPSPDVPIKASISSPALCPRVALVAPLLAVGSPARLTAACGADALGHAIESCMSRRANPVSTALAARAVRLIVKNLPRAVAAPDDPQPREPLALAATLAGAAFSSAGVVMTHAIAQALGALLHIPHGEAVAIAQPLNLRYNAAECVEVYSRLAHYCGITADSPEAQAERFTESIAKLQRSIGLPDRVQVPAGTAEQFAADLVENAFDSTPVPLTLNPRPIDRSTLKQLVLEILDESTG